MGLGIKQLAVGPFQVFTYIISSRSMAAIIDPAGDEDKLIKIIENESLRLLYILNTHAHADHILVNKILREYFNVPVFLHEKDFEFFSMDEIRAKAERELDVKAQLFADRILKDGDTLPIGDTQIKVIHTPGYTPGSVCFLVDGNLFTGDTLFVGAAGRTDLIGGSLDELLSSLSRIIDLPPETLIWPGHDYGEQPTSTIAQEKEENPYITDFIL